MRPFITLVLCLPGLAGTLFGGTDPYFSPSSLYLDPYDNQLFVAGGGSGKLLVLNPETRVVSHQIQFTRSVNGVVCSKENLFITSGGYEGMVYKVAKSDLEITDSLRVGHTPISPVIHKGFLYVCNRFSNTVIAISLTDFAITGEIDTPREPFALAVSRAGLLVANHLPSGAADTSYTGAVVSVINPSGFNIESEIPLPSGSTAVKDICVSADGKHAYLTHLVSRYMVPTTQLDRGWMVTNAMSIIDISRGSYLNTVLLDDVYRGAANPWGIGCSSDGSRLVVTHSGTHEISIIALDTLHQNLLKVSSGNPHSFSRNAHDVPHDLGFLANCRSRVKLNGIGPRELSMIGDKVFTAEYYSGTLGVVDLADPEEVESISLVTKESVSESRQGEQYFHDATFCFQNWLSCSSCHPDGRHDGINWDLGNDGYGTLRQTKSLLLVQSTPPTTITGIRPHATVSVRSGFEHIEFTRVEDTITQSVEAYLVHMKPEMSPFLVDGKLSEQAESGLELFKKAKCNTCHGGPAFTDMGMHQVGNGYTKEEKFDTPTLLETWRTGPYLHDGRARDLKSMLLEYNKDDLHGETSGLTAEELDDLVCYTLSISSLSPVIRNPVRDIQKPTGFATETIQLEGVFYDTDSEFLSYQVVSEHPGVVQVSLVGNDLVIREVEAGSARITITAKDGAGGFADHQFTVNITDRDEKIL